MNRYAVLGFVVATAAWAAPQGGGQAAQQQNPWSWRGRVEAGKTIEVRGVNGTIAAERASGAAVEVTAQKTARDDDPDEVRIEVVEHEGGVTICAVYPGRNNRCAPGGGRNNVNDNDVRVNFTVRVPDGVRFEGHSVNGDVSAAALTGPVSVRTVNGDVTLETSAGEASAQTVNGGIEAIVRGTGTGRLQFETVNGSITLSLPNGLGASLETETVNGSIESDFPIQVQGRMNPRHLSGQIGGGGRVLHAATVNGSIRLRRIG